LAGTADVQIKRLQSVGYTAFWARQLDGVTTSRRRRYTAVDGQSF